MQQRFSHRWADWVTRHWLLVLVAWLIITVVMRSAAPAWKDIAYDGDFEYLPAEMSSVAAGALLDEAFPGIRSRSQIVLILARENGALKKTDEIVGMDLLRRLYHRLAEVSWQRAIELGYESGPIEQSGAAEPWLRLTREALDQALAIDDRFYEAIADQVPDVAQNLYEPRMAIASWDRGKLLEKIQASPEAVGHDFEAALWLLPEIPKIAVPIDQRPLDSWNSLIDVMSWEDAMIGARLQNDRRDWRSCNFPVNWPPPATLPPSKRFNSC